MPYHIEPKDEKAEGPFKVVNSQTGEVKGKHATRAKAMAQLRALYANEPEASKRSKIDHLKIQEIHKHAGHILEHTSGMLEAAPEEPPEPEEEAEEAAEAKAISKREDVSPERGKAEYGDVKFADEKNKRYPIDNEQHIRAAWTYINQERNASKYDPDEVAIIKKHIISAWKDKIDKAGPPSEAEKKSLDLSYCKSLGVQFPSMAVKFVSLDTIKGYTFLWGSQKLTDVELEYFTKETNFWDDKLGKAARPLTWDHAQDETMKDATVIGTIQEWGDDEVGRWYQAKLERSHKYRKAIDALIEKGVLGTSSDSAPQYVRRVKTGKSTWLQEWPWFASALTDTPAEPRMIGSIDVLKSLGIILPEATASAAWQWNIERLKLAKTKL